MENEFLKKGWAVIDLADPAPVFEARLALEREFAIQVGTSCPLELYHTLDLGEEEHTELQTKMTELFRKNRFGRKIIEAQKEFFKSFISPDLLVQAAPYLRMTRPFKPQDNIGFHRDTFYGGSPYELSVLVPYVDVPSDSSLSVLSGSHIEPEDAYPTVQIENPDEKVRKGSSKHQLGFLYAPKVMDPSIEEKMEPVPLVVGQALVFMLSTVHGSVVNRGKVTRWSSDIRVLNALAPVDLSTRPNYYESLCDSVVSHCSKAYYEGRNKVELEYSH